MIKLGCGGLSLLCLLSAAFLMWQTPGFPEGLPSDLAGWAAAWFDLFENPLAALALLCACAAFAVAAASVTELLLGLIFSIATAAFSLLCLAGMLGASYPPFAAAMENFFK
jgi:hypothetical protein